jgi:DNA-binding beta-propeller fold protein YncE
MWIARLVAVGGLVCVTACGGGGGSSGGGQSYTVGGSLTGLAGHGLVLGNNGANPLSVSANGSFAFTSAVPDGAIYDVQVVTEPTGPSQTCAIAKGSGVVSGSNITNVAVTCTTNTYTVGGTVSGFSGNGLTLADSGSSPLSVSASGSFTFGTALPDGTSYNVTVTAQPSGPTQTCAVAKGNGTLHGANVTNVQVTCTTNSYSVGGTVSGLVGTGLALSLNGGAPIPISTDGPFQFPGTLLSGTNFNIAAATQPVGPFQSCLADNGSGTVGGSNVSVSVVCTSISAFAYIIDSSAGLIGYSVASQTGLLTQLPGTPFTNPTSNVPRNVVASPDGKKLYITEGGTIYAYSIAQPPSSQMGSLSLLGSTTIDMIYGLATDTSGQFIYATSVPNTVGAKGYVAAFKIDAATGALSPVAQYASGSKPFGIAAYPTASYLLVTNLASNDVSVFSIDSAAGTLTPVSGSPFAAGYGPYGVAPTPNGKFVYVTNDGLSGSAGLSSYTIDSSTGVLTPISNGSGGTSELTTVVVDPSSQFLFASGDIMYIARCLAINPVSGVPTFPCPFSYPQVPPPGFFAEAYAAYAFDPTGHFMYVTSGIGTRVLQFSSNPANLTWVQSTNAGATPPNGIAIAPVK